MWLWYCNIYIYLWFIHTLTNNQPAHGRKFEILCHFLVLASINPSVFTEFFSWCSSVCVCVCVHTHTHTHTHTYIYIYIYIYLNLTYLLFGRMIENWLYSLFINSTQGTFFTKFSPGISYKEQETMKLTIKTRTIFGLETELPTN